MDDLKPCPFCGSTIVGALQESTNPTDKIGVVGCGVCGASGPCNFEPHEFTARWNARASDPAPPTEGDAVQRATRTVELNTPITGESVKAAYVGQAAVTLVARVRELEARVRELEAADPARGMPPYTCGCPAVRSDTVKAFCGVHHKPMRKDGEAC